MDFLVNYALKNIWCNKGQNKQVIMQLARISSAEGVLNYTGLMNSNLPMPTIGEYYHVFQVGQVSPFLIGLITSNPTWAYQNWVSMQDTMNVMPLIADIYNINGVHVPRYDVFYRFTRSRDLVIAIRVNYRIPVDYANENIYVRLYSNAYFNIIGNTAGIVTAGANYGTTTDILALQTLYLKYKAMPGAVSCFINGLAADSIDLTNVNIGDSAEFIYDPSVKRVLTIPVSSLVSFNSSMDQKYKYLIHDSLANNSTVNYERDIDIYMVNPFTPGRYRGVYYHRNAADSHRMVTHRDYSVPVNYIDTIGNDFQNLAANIIAAGTSLAFPMLTNLNLLVYIREGGYNHSVPYVANRVHDLYKLSDAQVVEAMIGNNATVPIWTADALESSLYAEIMSNDGRTITDTMVQNALGYDAYAKILADTPSPAYSIANQIVADVPPGLQASYTAYEYDINGVMLGYYQGTPGNTYTATNPNTAKVEMLYGRNTYTPDVYFGTTLIAEPTGCNYRVYQEQYDGSWTDITGTTAYTVSGGFIRWSSTIPPVLLMVRTDKTLLSYDVDMMPYDGLLYLNFTETEDMNGTLMARPMPVPMGDLEVFLNGYSLVEGIDYIVHFPMLVITNVSRLVQPANTTVQKIHVRWTGFCDQNLNYNKPMSVGFVADGALSDAGVYEPIDGSVARLSVAGTYQTLAAAGIDTSKVGTAASTIYNGAPYSLKKQMVPIQNLIGTDLVSFMQEARSTDKTISQYLEMYLQKLTEPLMSIPQQYPVMSPFIVKILYVLVNNEYAPGAITVNMQDTAILAFCKQYESWLAFDPINSANTIDGRFAVIVPSNLTTTIELPLAAYSFLLSVVRLYGQGLVNLAAYITLKPL